MSDLPSNQSTFITAGAGIDITFTETEGQYWDITIEATGGAGGGDTLTLTFSGNVV